MELYKLDKEELEYLILQKTHFNINYNTSNLYKNIYDRLSSLSKNSSKEVWCIVTNTARALNYNASALSIPRDKEAYSGNAQVISCNRMVKLLDKLVQEDYLVFYKGGYLPDGSKIQSIYVFTDKYLDLWKNIDTTKELDTKPVIVIRDRETKEALTNRGKTGVKQLSDLVNKFNHKLLETDIYVDGKPSCTQRYFRVYSDNLTLGGRFYNTVGGVQTMSKAMRSKITIDGKPVIELDFKAMHPSILYEQAWQANEVYVEDWIDRVHGGSYNPYPYVSPFISAETSDDSWVVRKINKYALMVSLNAANFKQAQLALANEWYNDLKHKGTDRRKYADLTFGLGVNGKPTFPATNICKHLQDYNEPIAGAFFSDIGLALQNVESEIIGKVIDALISTDELLLPVHDSVIVKAELKEDVLKMMHHAYSEVLGSDRFCIIEAK